jgi:hypothetical protein
MLVVDHRKFHIIQAKLFRVWYVALYGFILTALLGLGGSYAAGSCRDSKHTIYVLSLVAPVVACLVLAWLLVDNQGTNHGRYGIILTLSNTPSILNYRSFWYF